MKDVLLLDVSQGNFKFRENCRDLAKDFGLSCEVKYLDMSFGFPWNTIHYKVVVDGGESEIEKFKQLLKKI